MFPNPAPTKPFEIVLILKLPRLGKLILNKKSMTKKVFAVIVTFLVAAPAFAVVQGNASSTASQGSAAADRQQAVQDIKSQRQDLAEQRKELNAQQQEMIQNRCEFIANRIQNRISAYEQNQNARSESYKNIRTRVQSIANRLKSDGYDTSQLETDLATLSDKIENISDDYATFISGLKNTQGAECGKSKGEFANRYMNARSAMLSVREGILDAKTFIQDTIRPDIQKIRAQKPASSSATQD
jgi:chromosome segregation ATPase